MAKKKPDNTRTAHTVGGVTTRDDPSDLGAPMAPPTPDNPGPQGPEDAFDPDTRGDYTGRAGAGSAESWAIVPDPDAKPGEPQVKKIRQS